MSFTDLFKSGEHSRNLSHFASLVNLARISDTGLSEKEQTLLARFAHKLGISEAEQKAVLKNPEKFPIDPPISHDDRLRRLHDLFTIIFADYVIEEDEHTLLIRYGIGLGFNESDSKSLIARTIQIYTGGLAFEDFKYLLNK